MPSPPKGYARGRGPFPTQHPYVYNKDGSTSNVLTITVEMDGKHYVLPSMVDGKKLSGRAAVSVAKKHGLKNYPSFKTAAEALEASKKLHGKQPPPRRAMQGMLKRGRRGLEQKKESIVPSEDYKGEKEKRKRALVMLISLEKKKKKGKKPDEE
jgi:hypothetical protein|tara:strand:+ start:4619 stop:5080 length:462 start_codon:yes stop_codon:yes gene_type:complete